MKGNEQLVLFNLPERKSEANVEAFKIAIAVDEIEQKKLAIDLQRYYFHRKLKNKYKINPDHWTIDIPYSSFKEIPDGDRYYIWHLKRLGYNLQYILL
ncbi:hypothetical protein ACVWYN_002714 [Pedobacter sp. UYP24]